jgi:hypothetical protein
VVYGKIKNEDVMEEIKLTMLDKLKDGTR